MWAPGFEKSVKVTRQDHFYFTLMWLGGFTICGLLQEELASQKALHTSPASLLIGT